MSLAHFDLDLFLSKEQATKNDRFSSFLDFSCVRERPSKEEKTVQELCTNILSKQNCTNATPWLTEKGCMAKSEWLPLVQPCEKTAPNAVYLCKNDTVCRFFFPCTAL